MLTLRHMRMSFIGTLALIAALSVPVSCSRGEEPTPRSVQLSAFFINQFIEESAKNEGVTPPEKAAISRALSAAAETSEQKRVLEGMFVHTSAPDMPLPELVRLLNDSQAEERHRLDAAACLAKVICGWDEKRAAEADSELLQAFRNRQNNAQLRRQLLIPLSISTRSPYILMGDLTETLTEPECVKEFYGEVTYVMSGLVTRRAVAREAAWSMLALALRREGLAQNARQNLLLVLGQVSSNWILYNDGLVVTRQLLSDTERLRTREFLNERNDDETREIAAIGLGLCFPIEPPTLEVARALIERESTSEQLRKSCVRLIEKSKRTDADRLSSLNHTIDYSNKWDSLSPDFKFDAAWR